MNQSVQVVESIPETSGLRAALENALSEYYGKPRVIAEFRCRASAYRSSFPLEELDMALNDGTRLQLVFKNLGELLEPARCAKPQFLLNPLREIETYRRILRPDTNGTAICYGAVAEPPTGRFWLFLEKVEGVELYQVGEWAVWQQAARWLGRLHTDKTRMVRAAAGQVPLLRYDAQFYQLWLERAAERMSGEASRRWMGRLAGRYDRVTSRLSELPATFIHGEFYASNVLVQQKGDGLRVCPVDWEMAGVGPGLIDLAALIAGKWTEEEKRALALTYYGALGAEDVGGLPMNEFLTALDCCRLHLALQWLGWSEEWIAPPEHGHDWLNEAMSMTRRLGL